MAKKYLKVNPIPGQFFVSEAWRSGISVADGGEHSKHQHNELLAQMILAGPFKTRQEAENWNTTNADGRAAVWQS